jgi:hypothetical protein
LRISRACTALLVAIVTTTVLAGGPGTDAVAAPSTRRPLAADLRTGTPGDHWHTYFAINVCGEWLPPAPPFEKAYKKQASLRNVGIHSHADGLIHIHPFTASESGRHATLGAFLANLGWDITSRGIDVSHGYRTVGPPSDPTRLAWHRDDPCTFGAFNGQSGVVVWSVDGQPQTGPPADYKLVDGATVAIGFLPRGAALPFPPNACKAFALISDQAVRPILSADSPCRAQSG